MITHYLLIYSYITVNNAVFCKVLFNKTAFLKFIYVKLCLKLFKFDSEIKCKGHIQPCDKGLQPGQQRYMHSKVLLNFPNQCFVVLFNLAGKYDSLISNSVS